MKQRPRGESRTRGICFIEGCSNLQAYARKWKDYRLYRKLCDKHHRFKYSITNNLHNPKYDKILAKKRNMPNKKCEICGWDKAPCDRHRKYSEEGYTEGNIIILCPNHHRQAHS